MKSQRKYVLISLLTSLVFVHPFVSAQNESDWDWVNKRFKAAFEEAFPEPKDPTLQVWFRTHRELHNDELEFAFWFYRDHVLVREAEGDTIYNQILKRRIEQRQDRRESLSGSPKVREWRVDFTSCTDAQRQAAKLSRLRFRVPERDVIIFHPTVNEFLISGGFGEMRINLYDDAHPLVRWARETRGAIRGCIYRNSTPHSMVKLTNEIEANSSARK